MHIISLEIFIKSSGGISLLFFLQVNLSSSGDAVIRAAASHTKVVCSNPSQGLFCVAGDGFKLGQLFSFGLSFQRLLQIIVFKAARMISVASTCPASPPTA